MMNDTEKKEHNGIFLSVRKNFRIYETAIRERKGSVSTSVLDSMDEWEFQLRDIMQAKGLLMPRKSDARFALASRK